MFDFSHLESLHLEITNNCQASCPMCSRNAHGGMLNPLITLSQWSIDDFKKIVNEEVLNQIKNIYFCGNFGDPLLNDHLIEMCNHVSLSDHVSIRIHTNGSLRNLSWWQTLAKSLPKNHVVIFGIDGLEDTHSRYRIGTDFNKIINNARAFIDAGGIAEWAFIVFEHNEHQVNEARKIASDLKFSQFTIKNSSRFVGDNNFPVYDKNGQTIDILRPPESSVITFLDKKVLENYKTFVENSEIDCYVLRNKEIYIDAHKNLMPCCFLASAPYNYTSHDSLIFDVRKEMLNQYQNLVKDLKNINVIERSIKEIVNSFEYQTVWKKYWYTDKLITCARTCGKNYLSKPIDQFVKRESLK